MKPCTYCGQENQDSAERCSACGKAFDNYPITPRGGDLKDPALDPVIVATFENTEHAGVLQTRLEDAGIESWIPEDFSFEFPPQTVSVQVAAKDAEAAREIALEFRKPDAEGVEKNAELASSAPPGPIPNSRACVSCGAPVPLDAALCPKCGWTQPQLA
jgi:ribosomal protein L40E